MKKISASFITALLIALLAVTSVFALFTNGSFESGNFSGWTQSYFFNLGLIGPEPFNESSIVRTAGGSDQSVVYGPFAALSQTDANSNNNVAYPAYGSYVAQVNGSIAGNISNSIYQETTVQAGDVDPLDGQYHVRFVYAAVMEDPGHVAAEQPWFFVVVKNVTKGTTLYQKFSYAAEPGVPWQAGAPGWKYLDWSLVDINPGPGALDVGDTISLEAIAADCALGGHAGYVYVDEFGPFIPGPTIAATGPATTSTGASITYTYNYFNGAAATVDLNVAITAPAGVDFTTGSDLTNCVVNAGSATCTFASQASGTGGSFTITGNVTAAGGSTISHGDYNIGATGYPTVGGPLVTTDVPAVPAIEVYVAGTLEDSFTQPPGTNSEKSYVLNNGPVRVVSNNGMSIFTSERTKYKNSFNEIVGYPANQLTTDYWFTSLDDVGMTTFLVIGNPDTTQTALVDVYIGGTKMNATPYSIAPGARIYPRYGINGGPVHVVSTNSVPIFTSERTLYKDSFNEVMGYPGDQLTTDYWFTSLDDAGMVTFLVIGNPDTTQTALVDVYIAGTKMNATPYSIAPGARIYPRYGINAGPVHVVSTNGVPIFTSERTKYLNSFNEIMGYPGNQLTTDYWFTTLDDAGMVTFLVIGNPDTTQTALVDVYIAGTKINATPYSIAPGARIYPRYGIDSGPVHVVSTNGVPVFASERSKYLSSFNEVMGFPGNKLTTEYWFTTYDGIGMTTNLMFAAP